VQSDVRNMGGQVDDLCHRWIEWQGWDGEWERRFTALQLERRRTDRPQYR